MKPIKRLIIFTSITLLIAAFTSCQDVKNNCPNKSVGKITYRVVGHYCKKKTDTERDARLKASQNFMKQANKACKAGPAKNCEGAICKDKTKKCTIQITNIGPANDPTKLTVIKVNQDPLCDNGVGYYAVPTKKGKGENEWFFECECNCTPR